jgi:LuxR family maltose regulon positive regulatory protein
LIERGLDLLHRLLSVAETAGATGHVIEILVAIAVALWALDDGEPAISALERALCLAEPQGYVRVFVGEGATMGAMLQQVAARGVALDYVRRLLAALGDEMTGDGSSVGLAVVSRVGPATLGPLEPLSERELQVLRLLPSTLSSSEMAEQLYLSPNTVRTHIRNIYRKLDAHARAEAIQRAHELGLL